MLFDSNLLQILQTCYDCIIAKYSASVKFLISGGSRSTKKAGNQRFPALFALNFHLDFKNLFYFFLFSLKIHFTFFLQPFHENFPLCLVARLAKKGKHILLVALDARLVEGIHTQNISADTAGKLKEIE